jgi:hypothetical protein
MFACPTTRRSSATFACLLLTACGSVRDWRELRTDPMPIGEVYDGLTAVAAGDGFFPDNSVSDRGHGIWQSRWKERLLDNRHPGRFRLRAEVDVDTGAAAAGWDLRYRIEQETVDDLRRSSAPAEDDWSADGQDGEREAIFGEKLVRRLAPKTLARPRATRL